MAKPARIELLGQLRLRVGDADVVRFRTYKTGALLAYLAYHLGKPCPREELIEMLWPDTPSDQARNSLSQSLSSLRHLLEPIGVDAGTVLEAGRHSVRLIEDTCETDVADFRGLAKVAIQAKARGEEGQWETKARSALRFFKGEFLPGIYEDWTLVPREHLREEALTLLDDLSKLAENRTDTRARLDLALHAATLDPTREVSHRTAIACFTAMGQPDAALKQYRTLERALAALGLKPSDETKAMVRTALRSEVPEVSVPKSTGEPMMGTPTWVLTDARPQRFGNPSEALEHARTLLQGEPAARVAIATGASPDGISPDAAAIGQIVADAATAALLPGEFIDLGRFELSGGPAKLFASTETAKPPAANRVTFAPTTGLTRFYGRGDDVEALTNLLKDGWRLITLTGPGGMGKTRLSQEVGRAAQWLFPNGVVFVRLESIVAGPLIWDALASALQLMVRPNIGLEDQVLAPLEEGGRLLIFDNFEQLCEQGGPAVLAELLERAPGVSVIVSSRRRADVEGEVEYPVAPLPQPDEAGGLEELAANPSVALFLDRAKSAKPDFQLTAGNRESVMVLCRQLEGIPLALELAAARVQVLSPSQILLRFNERLDLLTARSKVERHRSLRNAIDWSYSYLPGHLQAAFRSLAVFQEGWDEFLAQHMLGNQVALDLLAELRDFSLISSQEIASGDVRFSMLDTLREYAKQIAGEVEWERLRAAHASAVLVLCESLEPKLSGPEQMNALDRMEAERMNIRAAIEWSVQSGEIETGLRLCSAAGRFWHLRSLISEGRSLSRLVLDQPGGTPLLRARGLLAYGRMVYMQGDYDESVDAHQEAMDLAPDSLTIRTTALQNRGAVAYTRGRYDEAGDLFLQCLAIRKEADDAFGTAHALQWLGILNTELANYDLAEGYLQEALSMRETIGDLSGIARCLNSLGVVARRRQRPAEAASFYERSLDMQRRLGGRDSTAIGTLLSNLAIVSRELGDYPRATELLAEAHKMNREIGDRWTMAAVEAVQGMVALDTGHVAEAMALNASSLRIRSGLGNQWGVAFSLEGSALALLEAGSFEIATRALSCARRIRATLNAPLPASDAATVQRAMARAAEVGGESFELWWRSGEDTDQAEIVEQVLAALDRRSLIREA